MVQNAEQATVQFPRATVIQVESRDYTDKNQKSRTYRAVMFRYMGNIFKLQMAADASLTDFERAKDKEATIAVALSTFGDRLSPDMRAASIALK